MKENNAHSLKVWRAFYSRIGGYMMKWNMSHWLPFSEDVVTFNIRKPNFIGSISVAYLTSDYYTIAFQAVGQEKATIRILNEDSMVNFIDTLGNEVVGHRAPAEGVPAQAAR